jgi:hypothetical protein
MADGTKLAASIAVAGALGTLLGATVAPVVNYWTNERQMDVKMVEIGIGILRSPPTEDIAVMRSWAVDVIEASSKRRFTSDQRAALLKHELAIKWDAPAGDLATFGKVMKALREGKF